jgi:hypothetical protein
MAVGSESVLAETNAPGGVTVLDIMTLAIAVAGLLIATISLTWQVVQHRLTGSVVRVELLAGAFGRGGVATGPIAGFNMRTLAGQGFNDPVLAVRGRNIGRLAVDVTGWDIYTGDGFGYTLPGYGPNPTLPYRLEPGSTVTFYCPLADVRALFDSKQSIGRTDSRLRGSLTLGTGAVAQSGLVSFL